MVVALTVLNEESLVISRRRNRLVLQGNRHRELFAVARILYANHPRLSVTIAEKPRIAAGGDAGVCDAVSPDYLDAAFDGIALGDSAQVYAYAVRQEADGPVAAIRFDEAIVQAR